jgi:hypothetical protein
MLVGRFAMSNPPGEQRLGGRPAARRLARRTARQAYRCEGLRPPPTKTPVRLPNPIPDAVDERLYASDPDAMFDWEDVVMVEMTSAAPVQCPISLDCPPDCPQITPCGHVYSFGSIMRHLIMHGGEQLRRSAPCPLCFQPLVARELRLVAVRAVSRPAIGDALTFTLLRRPRGSVLPRPAGAAAAAGPSPRGGGMKGADGGCAEGEPSVSAGAGLLASNPFPKYAIVADAAPLWRAAALDLARAAARAIAEGGAEAAVEVPPISSQQAPPARRQARAWGPPQRLPARPPRRVCAQSSQRC